MLYLARQWTFCDKHSTRPVFVNSRV